MPGPGMPEVRAQAGACACERCRGEGTDDAPWGMYCTLGYVAMQEATGWMELGEPGRAVMIFERELAGYPACDQVDTGVFRARLALAYAQDGRADRAASTALGAWDIACATGSWRARSRSLPGCAAVQAAGRRGTRRFVSPRSSTPMPGGPARFRGTAKAVSHLVTTATSCDVRSQDAKIAVLPVGSFEQHGDFLPLATDTIVASLIAQRIAAD